MTSPHIPAGELEEFRAAVRKFAVDAFAAKAAYWDEKEEFPQENRELLAKLGYLGLVIPEQYGGSGLSILHATVFLEEISRVCFNTALVCQVAINGRRSGSLRIGQQKARRRAASCGKCSSMRAQIAADKRSHSSAASASRRSIACRRSACRNAI